MIIDQSIRKLRERNHLSQAKFAELFQVSPQAVQKWEQGVSHPTVANLIAIAKHFHVSVDSLLLGSDGRTLEEMQYSKEIFPDFAGIHEWESYAKNMELEYQQTTDEGYDLSRYRDLFAAVAKLPDSKEKEQMADILFSITANAAMQEDYPYTEPSDLTEIRALREEYPFPARMPGENELKKKVAGAWYGRICGCLLGKPIESIRTNELFPLLKEIGNSPMYRYINSTDITDDMCNRYHFRLKGQCWADTVSWAPVDDDTNYTVLAQLLIDKCGKNFTPADVGNLWLSSQGKNAYCTAERIAFLNLVNGYAPPNSALYKNPYREWIGAQIRGDYYGYINPGDPAMAAEMAWRDASISHIKNGIYGEMFVAAMLACAAVSNNTYDIIRGGLAQIPATSRLYRDVTAILQNHQNGMSSEDCFAGIHAQYDEYTAHGWCHTNSNAMVVTAALLYGGGDYGKSICLAVQTGFDTDCNGATVGSVVGMQKGLSAIGEEWTAAIHGTLDTSIFGVGKVAVTDLIEKTMEHINL